MVSVTCDGCGNRIVEDTHLKVYYTDKPPEDYCLMCANDAPDGDHSEMVGNVFGGKGWKDPSEMETTGSPR